MEKQKTSKERAVTRRPEEDHQESGFRTDRGGVGQGLWRPAQGHCAGHEYLNLSLFIVLSRDDALKSTSLT